MIGTWQRFGEGEPPADGEALVVIRYGAPADTLFATGYGTEAVPVIHRGGTLFEQYGASYPIPYGWWWTSLPSPRRREEVGVFPLRIDWGYVPPVR